MTKRDREELADQKRMRQEAKAVRDASILRMIASGQRVEDVRTRVGVTADYVKRLCMDAGIEWPKRAKHSMLAEGLP